MAVPSLIERWLPAPVVGAESLRDASAAQKPPPNRLHVWWARRPLTASRAAIVASLLPAWPTDDEAAADERSGEVRHALEREFPGGEEEYRKWFVRVLGIAGDPVAARAAITAARAQGTTTDGNAYGYDRAYTVTPSSEERERIHRLARVRGAVGNPPVVLDPFAGGGSIPLEAARYGCETIANELNPVASAILAATISLPLAHGPELPALVRRYGERWCERIRERLDSYFPREQANDRLAYVWAHAIPCPETGHLTPLIPNSWLANAGAKRVAIAVEGDAATGEIRRRLVTGDEAGEVGPTGTYKGGNAVSIFTGQPITGATIRESAQAGRLGEILLAVVVTRPGVRGRSYRLPTPEDLAAVGAARAEYARREPELEVEGVLPTEAVEEGHKTDEPRRMGLTTWRSMFTPRQALGYATGLSELRGVVADCRGEDGEEAARAVALYLGFAVDKGLNYNARLNGWHPTRETGANVFDRHDFAFKHTFAELDASRALFPWAVRQVDDALRGIVKLVHAPTSLNGGAPSSRVRVLRGSATSLSRVPTASVDAVVTDPPYYDNVIYSECSDYFYVWLKRALRDTWPEFCELELTEKRAEAVANPALFRELATHSGRGRREPGTKTALDLATGHYERLLADSWREAHRVLRDDGVLTVMFTHKRVDAWDTLGASLLAAGFSIHSSWPVHTESEHSLHQAKKNSASSTIFLACRKRPTTEPAYWTDIRGDVARAARRAAADLARDGLTGVDLTVATFGPVLSVLSRSWPVYTGELDDHGQSVIIRPDVALDLARGEVAKLKKAGLLGGKTIEFDRPTDWYLLAWSDFRAAEFPAGEALKLSLATHLDLADLLREHKLAKAASGTVTLLSPKQRRTARAIDLSAHEHPTLVDALHALMVIYDEDGLGAARSWLAQRNLLDSERFAGLVRAALFAIPRTKLKGEWVREEARVLDSLRETLFPDLPIPAEQARPEDQLALALIA